MIHETGIKIDESVIQSHIYGLSSGILIPPARADSQSVGCRTPNAEKPVRDDPGPVSSCTLRAVAHARVGPPRAVSRGIPPAAAASTDGWNVALSPAFPAVSLVSLVRDICVLSLTRAMYSEEDMR